MSDRRFDFSNERVKTPWREGPDGAEVRTPEPYVVRVPVLDLLDAPGGARDRQVLYNDAVDVLEVRDGFAFGCAMASGYVGYLRADGLVPAPKTPVPDHWVAVRMTHAYEAPEVKSREQMALSMGTQLSVLAEQDGFTETEAGWVPSVHLTGDIDADPVGVAERLVGTPYLWGGNSAFGIDCSGLVWSALTMCGAGAMPDSDLQQAHDGDEIADGSVRRGDLWFWKGHVAIVLDEVRLIHANAHHMAVAVEDIDSALGRIGATIARKRISLPHE